MSDSRYESDRIRKMNRMRGRGGSSYLSARDGKAGSSCQPNPVNPVNPVSMGMREESRAGLCIIRDTLQATALVHETYLRLVDQTNVDWRDRAHFFGLASQKMRHILPRSKLTGARYLTVGRSESDTPAKG